MNIYKEFELYDKMWDALREDIQLEALPAKPGIYCIIFNNKDLDGQAVNRKYVGLAKNIQNRIYEHLKAARPDGRDYVVYNAMRKHTYEVIVLEVLEEYDIKKLAALEQQWIKDLHTYIYDNTESTASRTVEYNGRTYELTCSGPGYNMTTGGEGAPVYTKEIIDELIELYIENSYSHVKTYKDFREKYKNHNKFSKLSYDTLHLFIEAAGLPWINEQEKKTFVFANTIKQIQTQEADGHTRDKQVVIANTTDLKYRVSCDSQAQADALVDFIWKRFSTDHEQRFKEFLATCKKRERENSGATRIKWMYDNDLYDEYLDLSQYDLGALTTSSKSRGGEGNADPNKPKVVKGRGSLCSIVYNN
jgi:hypothetical protein